MLITVTYFSKSSLSFSLPTCPSKQKLHMHKPHRVINGSATPLATDFKLWYELNKNSCSSFSASSNWQVRELSQALVKNFIRNPKITSRRSLCKWHTPSFLVFTLIYIAWKKLWLVQFSKAPAESLSFGKWKSKKPTSLIRSWMVALVSEWHEKPRKFHLMPSCIGFSTALLLIYA